MSDHSRGVLDRSVPCSCECYSVCSSRTSPHHVLFYTCSFRQKRNERLKASWVVWLKHILMGTGEGEEEFGSADVSVWLHGVLSCSSSHTPLSFSPLFFSLWSLNTDLRGTLSGKVRLWCRGERYMQADLVYSKRNIFFILSQESLLQG